MVEMPPRCPDCGVETEPMTLNASQYNLQFISEERTDGILGTLGVKERFDATAFVCPECGLSRLYADLDE